MPFIRACYLTHPQSGAAGLWVELSTDPPGTLTGGLRSAWPAIVLSGGGKDTIATYGVKVSNWISGLCTKTIGVILTKVVVVTVQFTNLSPLTLDPDVGVVISEGDCKVVVVR